MQLKLFWIALAAIILFSFPVFAQTCPEPQPGDPDDSKHFLFGRPEGGNPDNLLINQDIEGEARIFEASHNTETKFADWVAYCIDSVTAAEGENERNYFEDPAVDNRFEVFADTDSIDDNKINEYACSNWLLHYDRGHQAPRAAFEGIPEKNQINSFINLTPQRSELNQGIWQKLEIEIRSVAKMGFVYVITGPLYERPMPKLPNALLHPDHVVPSGYWKIVAIGVDNDETSLRTLAFIFEQFPFSEDPGDRVDEKLRDFIVTIDDIESRSGFDFFPQLTPEFESDLESGMGDDMIVPNLDKKHSITSRSTQRGNCSEDGVHPSNRVIGFPGDLSVGEAPGPTTSTPNLLLIVSLITGLIALIIILLKA